MWSGWVKWHGMTWNRRRRRRRRRRRQWTCSFCHVRHWKRKKHKKKKQKKVSIGCCCSCNCIHYANGIERKNALPSVRRLNSALSEQFGSHFWAPVFATSVDTVKIHTQRGDTLRRQVAPINMRNRTDSQVAAAGAVGEKWTKWKRNCISSLQQSEMRLSWGRGRDWKGKRKKDSLSFLLLFLCRISDIWGSCLLLELLIYGRQEWARERERKRAQIAADW